MKNLNLIRLSKVNNLPLTKATLYKWHHVRKHPQLFIKLGGAVFVDLDAFEQLISSGRGK